MRHRLLLTFTLCMAGTWACTTAADPTSPGNTETLALERDENGNLRYCDADDPSDCVTVSNPNDCATLQIEIDTATGATCERCIGSNGEVTYERCEDTAIACTLVTAPEPDCVVCAHVDGPVLYSTCIPDSPEHCEYYPVFDEDGGVRECERCYDRRGNIISDTCGPDCSNVSCPAIACAPGYRPVVPPGECCPICVPEDRCENSSAGAEVCPDVGIPECPQGWEPVRDPTDCCSYYCAPRDCSAIQCPAIVEECPPGFHWETEYPNCCGICVPDDEPERCQSDAECGPERYCSEPVVCESRCDGATDPGSDGGAGSSDPSNADDPGVPCEHECYGLCRPFECPVYGAPDYRCEGEWVNPGYDGAGCPRPPICICPDGTEAENGRCIDRCALVDCALPPVQECGPGEEWTNGFPYCCGACVPKERALCEETGGDWELGCGHTNCNYAVACVVPEEGCNCGPRMSWVDGEGCVPDPSCTDGEPCVYEGETYPSGSEFPAGDGCNACFCLDGQIACTDAHCQECWGAWVDANGTCRAPNDGLYPAYCCDEATLCRESGGAWDETSCGHYACGQPPACDAVIPGCDCGFGANFVAGQGCVESDACGDRNGCTTASGGHYADGSTWPKGDGCNTCVCVDGAIYCTEAACAP